MGLNIQTFSLKFPCTARLRMHRIKIVVLVETHNFIVIIIFVSFKESRLLFSWQHILKHVKRRVLGKKSKGLKLNVCFFEEKTDGQSCYGESLWQETEGKAVRVNHWWQETEGSRVWPIRVSCYGRCRKNKLMSSTPVRGSKVLQWIYWVTTASETTTSAGTSCKIKGSIAMSQSIPFWHLSPLVL